MFTDIINQFEHIAEAVKNADVETVPFKHLYVHEVIKYDSYRTITTFEEHDDLSMIDEYGRKEYTLDITDGKLWEEESNKLFQEICKKLKLGKVSDSVPATIKFWEDSPELEITDIHTDAFYDTDLTISCQIYLPKDFEQIRLGTKLYRYIGDNILEDANQDEGTSFPHQAKIDKQDKWQHSRSVPFKPNSMLVTVSTKDSWHQAPIVPEGIRKSLMLRFKV
jgi:hypothetical protein|tara:strand:+ start:25419 stop:26084 length:666 start_codon:yes stop_codon:yes gene_type:complete